MNLKVAKMHRRAIRRVMSEESLAEMVRVNAKLVETNLAQHQVNEDLGNAIRAQKDALISQTEPLRRSFFGRMKFLLAGK